MDGYAEVFQKRASGRSLDDVPEADFWSASLKVCSGA